MLKVETEREKKIRSTVDKLSSGKQESTAFVFFICIDALCWWLFIYHAKEQRETRMSLSMFIQQYV
jgi:hypothetical protein